MLVQHGLWGAYHKGAPRVLGVDYGSDTGLTAHACAIPSHKVGDLLVAVWSFGGAGANAVSAPGGWETLLNNGSATTRKGLAVYKVADGSEGSTVAASTTNTAGGGAVCLRISNFRGVPELTENTGNSANPDPPSLSPTWGRRSTLWLAVGLCAGNTFTGFPSGYSGEYQPPAIAGNAQAAVGVRQFFAASDNPGPFATTLASWRAFTIAVRGAGNGN